MDTQKCIRVAINKTVIIDINPLIRPGKIPIFSKILKYGDENE